MPRKVDASDVTVRGATVDDYPQVSALLDALDALHRDGAPWMFKVPASQPRPREQFAGLLKQDKAAVFVAEHESVIGVVYGALRAAPDFPVFIAQHWGLIDGVMIEPAFRGRGIGRLLVEHFEAWALDMGAAWVELNVYEFNADAHGFYESLGYGPVLTKLRKARSNST